jgi:hypothetical protein
VGLTHALPQIPSHYHLSTLRNETGEDISTRWEQTESFADNAVEVIELSEFCQSNVVLAGEGTSDLGLES